ncbi:hypothetical protein ScalyP_jg4797 [Parmales sp. scaly parma]|nr:hypothetical protein ScalyP_jg4797 [Parmales sp. scaly parma]
MGRGGKKGGRGRGGGAHFAATSAEEIAIRNARLEEFDKERLQKRKEKQEEAGTGPAKKDDGEGEEEVFEGMESAEDVGARLAEQTLNDEEDEQQYKPKGLEGIIETANPNAIKAVHGIKIKDMDKTAAAPMSRKEREAKEKEEAAERYRKKHALGLTEEYRTDMAKLNEVKARRAKQQEARDEKEALEVAQMEAAKLNSAKKDNQKEKKTKDDGAIPTLTKIQIKKMKPKVLKEALQERKLDIQGNAKALTDRLLAYEETR